MKSLTHLKFVERRPRDNKILLKTNVKFVDFLMIDWLYAVLRRIGNISAGWFSYEMDRIALSKIMFWRNKMHQGIVLSIFL